MKLCRVVRKTDVWLNILYNKKMKLVFSDYSIDKNNISTTPFCKIIKYDTFKNIALNNYLFEFKHFCTI